MKTTEKIAIAIAVPAITLGSIILIAKAKEKMQRYLCITAEKGGTTDPPPGRYLYSTSENVTITAIPDSGYTVGTWNVDGVDWGHQDSITVTMDTNHTVIVTFWEGGQPPPPTTPYAIIPEKGYDIITLTSNIGVTLHRISDLGDWHTRYDYCNEEWSPSNPVTAPIIFKVIDVEGNGVPNIDVSLWVEDYPDNSKYSGLLTINGEEATGTKPLVLKTDSNGRVEAKLNYFYGLNDNFKTICTDAGIGYWISLTGIIIPVKAQCPDEAYDCRDRPWWLGIPYGPYGEGTSGTAPMPMPYVNFVHAQVVGHAKYAASTVKCGFHVKWIEFLGHSV